MGSQQFSLKWNNHHSNMIEVFDQLLSNGILVDVTLACEGMSLKAHRMILSACSPFFKSLFEDNPCKHPIVILKDIKYDDLKAVVNFMYRGEVNILPDDLSSLLKTAEMLQVKGLAEVTSTKPEVPVRKNAVPSSFTPTVSAQRNSLTCLKRKRMQHSNLISGHCYSSSSDDDGTFHKRAVLQVMGHIEPVTKGIPDNGEIEQKFNPCSMAVSSSRAPILSKLKKNSECDASPTSHDSHHQDVPLNEVDYHGAPICYDLDPTSVVKLAVKSPEPDVTVPSSCHEEQPVVSTGTAPCTFSSIETSDIVPVEQFHQNSSAVLDGESSLLPLPKSPEQSFAGNPFQDATPVEQPYQGIKRYGTSQWTEYQMQNAIDAVMYKGMSLREAASVFGVSKSTVWLRTKGLKRQTSLNTVPLCDVQE